MCSHRHFAPLVSMSTLLVAVVVAVITAASAGCGGATASSTDAPRERQSSADSGASVVRIHEPQLHRATMLSCNAPRAAGITVAATPETAGAGCRTDADCTAGMNGRCLTGSVCSGGPCMVTPPTCSYDTCSSDGDCAAGAACVCRSDVGPATNDCSQVGNCRVDADCGANGYCSPQPSTRSCADGVAPQFFCHTASDECVDDSDCPVSGSVSSVRRCAFDPVGKKAWLCTEPLSTNCPM